MNSLTLDQAPFGVELLVSGFDLLEESFELYLEHLGIYPGATLEKLHKAPLGNPIAIQIGEQSFALQKELCQKIKVVLSS